MTRILGISCFYHDAAACLVEDGRILAAAEEERFSRYKHDSSFPAQAARFCLESVGIVAEDLDYVIFFEKPILKFERILAGYTETFPRSWRAFERAMEVWLSQKLWIGSVVRKALAYGGPILFGEHHVSHAASAYFPSPFDEAAVVTADGVGEWATATIGVGHGNDLELTHEIRYPHSLGLLYSAFTSYLGFEVNDGEYKVMGMAAYGRPRYVDKVRRLIDLADDGSFHLDMKYLSYHHSLRSLNAAFIELFGPARRAESELEERHADVAASIQAVTEEAMLGLARRARETSGCDKLCLAGGVALNVLANARILREAGFTDVWVQPAAGDSGGSVGAALYLYHTVLRGESPRQPMTTAYLGPSYSDDEIRVFLERKEAPFSTLDAAELPRRVAHLLADGNVVGWFQGRMEFGPRALGARSILADPTEAAMRDKVNEKIKHRERFRPFAPVVMLESCDEYFDFGASRAGVQSPFMLLAARTRPEKIDRVRAVTHVDGTARVQTLRRQDNPSFHALLEEFAGRTGVPVLLNTSFNVRGEPIVCTPAEAFDTFSRTDIDYLVLGDALVPASSKRTPSPLRSTAAWNPEVVV